MDRILIAAQGPRPSSLLEQSLQASGYATKVVRDHAAARQLVRDEPFDLFILDVEPPIKSWDSTLRDLRNADERLPVMVLTPESDADEEVVALEGDADDCVTKPFGIEEVLARVRARLRSGKGGEPTVLGVRGIRLDLEARTAEVQGQPVELTSRELSLLEMLMRHPDEVLSRERLLAHVWGYDYDPGSNIVAVYVGYLRSKLGEEAIETVRGVGYRLGGY
jgi:DNA-binding response OmpR family regulator